MRRRERGTRRWADWVKRSNTLVSPDCDEEDDEGPEEDPVCSCGVVDESRDGEGIGVKM